MTWTQEKKFVRALRFERPSEIPFPNMFYKFHPETLRRWQREGLPKDVHLIEYLGLERCELIPVNVGPLPNYEAVGLEEIEEWRLGVDRLFFTALERKIRSVEEEFPIGNAVDSESFKKILNPYSPARYPRFGMITYAELKRETTRWGFPRKPLKLARRVDWFKRYRLQLKNRPILDN
ncbi:MAG: hypothetical protein FGF52_02840 [Candidatus Brockarchaeota archaeon]|nr:hypothetical protein [Candidatus Brockarchaeota archaeon]